MVIAFCRSQRLLHAHTSHCAQRQNAAGPASSSGEEGTASQQGWLGCWHGQRSWNIECLGTKDNPSDKSHCVVHWRAELSQGLGTSSFPWVQHKGGTWLPHPQCLWLPHGVDTGKLTFCTSLHYHICTSLHLKLTRKLLFSDISIFKAFRNKI